MQREMEFDGGMGLLTRQWSRFHRENPEVWELFERFGREALARDREHFSARAVWQRMRWYVAFETTDFPYDLKLNNNHTPFYARMFMAAQNCPGFFEIRSSEADDVNYHLMIAETRKGKR